MKAGVQTAYTGRPANFQKKTYYFSLALGLLKDLNTANSFPGTKPCLTNSAKFYNADNPLG